ncbi:MAG: hypothetical protein AABX16_04540 [Nanoarchaeota archaeon]
MAKEEKSYREIIDLIEVLKDEIGLQKIPHFTTINKKSHRTLALTSHSQFHFIIFYLFAKMKLLASCEVFFKPPNGRRRKSLQARGVLNPFGAIKQCVSDHESQFISNVDGDSRFKAYLKSKNIQQALCKIKCPQSNGKVEKFFDCYDRNRDAFKNLKEFIYWCDKVRPHRALQFEIL